MDVMKLLVLLLTVGSSFAERNAPVLVWESTSTGTPLSDLASFPATSNAQLKNLLDSLDSEALVIFIMNELNVEDFSGHLNELHQLKNEFESSQHMYAPSMRDPSQVPAMLSSYSRVTVHLDNLSALKLAPDAQKTLFLVYINDKPSADRNKALQESDNVISRVLSQVRTLTKKYSAVLTGKYTSMGGEESRRVARSLQAAVDPPLAYFFNLSCIYVYTSAAPVMRFSESSGNTVQLNLTSALVTTNTSSCTGNQSATITWTKVPGPTGYSLDTVELKFSFTYRKSGRSDAQDSLSSWTVPNVTITYSGQVAGKAVSGVQQTLDMDDVYAPAHFSYHCTSRKWAVENNTVDTMTSLELPGLQVQAFLGNTATAFGRAWDCTTFFTIPIWSGLFLSLILLLIFIWSMYMLASVPTSDRFDDPRGQPLHVPISE